MTKTLSNAPSPLPVAPERRRFILRDPGQLAQYNSRCGWCGKYIVAGRSRIVPLGVPLPPPPSTLYARRGAFVSLRTGHAVTPRALGWCHARCGDQIAQREEDLEALAIERRLELATMRRDSREHGSPGSQRPKERQR